MRSIRRLLVPCAAIAVAATALPGAALPAHARSEQAPTHRPELSDVLPGATPANFHSRYAALARQRSGLCGQLRAAANPAETPLFDAVPVSVASPDGTSDLGGDGHADILVLRLTDAASALQVRHGDDGRLLWTISVPGTLVWLAPMRLGTSAGPGLLLETMTFTRAGSVNGGEFTVALHIHAYAGQRGHQLWQRTVTGLIVFDPLGTVRADLNVPWPEDILPAAAGKAGRALVSETSDVLTLPAAGLAVRPVIVDGSDGSVHSGGQPVLALDLFAGVARHITYVTMAGVGDLNGDGYGDFAVGTDNLQARSSSTGDTLWQRPGLPQADPSGIPNAGSGGRPDVAVITAADKVFLLDGRTGHTVLTTTGESVHPLGDANDDGRTDIVVIHITGRGEASSLQLSAYTLTPVRRLWNRLLVFGTDRPFKILVTPVGDIQPDGTTEIRLQLFSSKYVDDLVDGTTGSLSPYGDLGDPLFASVDGHGDDFVTLDFNSPYTVTVTDGNTRSTIWNYTPPGGGDVTLSAVATQLTADQHADVLGVAFDQHDRAHVGVLDGARGTLRWQVQVS